MKDLYKEMYTMPPALSKEAISEALSLFTPEERAELMQKSMAPDKLELDLSQITDLEFDGIDHKDHPDYCDVFVCAAEYQGREMTDTELDDLNDNHSEWVNEKLFEYLY